MGLFKKKTPKVIRKSEATEDRQVRRQALELAGQLHPRPLEFELVEPARSIDSEEAGVLGSPKSREECVPHDLGNGVFSHAVLGHLEDAICVRVDLHLKCSSMQARKNDHQECLRLRMAV